MRRSTSPFSRKLRQLRYLLKMIKQKGLAELDQAMSNKLQRLYMELKNVFGKRRLHLALKGAGLMLFLGMAQQSQAQNFAPPVTNAFGFQSFGDLYSPMTGDLDGDGDLDICGVTYDQILYYENTGSATAPAFGFPQVSPFGLGTGLAGATTGSMADLDGDGDLDIITGDYYGGNFTYYENIGTPTAPNFSPAQLNPFGLSATLDLSLPVFGDLDGDGDLDIYNQGYYGGFTMYENIGTSTAPNFGPEIPNPHGIVSNGALHLHAIADIDMDGDQDIMMLEPYYSGFKYYENIGSATAPAFGTPVINPFGLITTSSGFLLDFGDMDNDGDVDLIIGDAYYGDLFYYENISIFVNSPPSSSDFAVQGVEDEVFFFNQSYFQFNDANAGDTLSAIEIISLPSNGTLKLDEAVVLVGEIIFSTDLGMLNYLGDANGFGAAYDAFNFKVLDASGELSVDAYLAEINLSPVNDAPESNDFTVMVDSDSLVFSNIAFPFVDIENDPLTAIEVSSLPATGTIMNNGVAVMAGDMISVADFGMVEYIADPTMMVYTTDFLFKVNDGIDNSMENTITLDVAIPVGLNNPIPSIEVALVSNPIQGAIQLSIGENLLGENLQVLVYDALGRTVSQSQEVGSSIIEISSDHLSKGTYIIQVISDKGMKSMKAIIE